MMNPSSKQKEAAAVRIAQINVFATSAEGRIAVQLCRQAEKAGHRSIICHAHDYAPTDVNSYRIGSTPLPGRQTFWSKKHLAQLLAAQADRFRCWLNTDMHLFGARLTGRSGFFSKRATKKLIKQLELFKPDIVHLHTLHGYYLHLPTLFRYLKENDLPVVWTLNDCWAFTGHCACYNAAENAPTSGNAKRSRVQKQTIGCERWQTGCGKCVLRKAYPRSWLFDRSARNWKEKRALFSGLNHMVITTPSQWLMDELKLSFLKDYPAYVISGCVDTDAFRPCASGEYMHQASKSYGLDALGEKHLVLSVAEIWNGDKGLDDLKDLAKALGPDYCIAALGLSEAQLEEAIPDNFLCVPFPGNTNDLAALYTAAEVCVSTRRDDFSGLHLLQAMACGTPVVCYDTGALDEVVTQEVGETVPTGNVDELAQAVRRICQAFREDVTRREADEQQNSKTAERKPDPFAAKRSGTPSRKEDEKAEKQKQLEKAEQKRMEDAARKRMEPTAKSCLRHAARYRLSDGMAAYQRLYEKVYRFSPAYQNAQKSAAEKKASSAGEKV